MANGFKTGGKNFPKGNKYGTGFGKLSDEQKNILKQIRSLNGKVLISKYCLMNYKELKAKVLDPNTPCIDLMLMRMIDRCISKAELPILIWIYERLGWSKEEIQDGEEKKAPRLYIKFDDKNEIKKVD